MFRIPIYNLDPVLKPVYRKLAYWLKVARFKLFRRRKGSDES